MCSVGVLALAVHGALGRAIRRICADWVANRRSIVDDSSTIRQRFVDFSRARRRLRWMRGPSSRRSRTTTGPYRQVCEFGPAMAPGPLERTPPRPRLRQRLWPRSGAPGSGDEGSKIHETSAGVERELASGEVNRRRARCRHPAAGRRRHKKSARVGSRLRPRTPRRLRDRRRQLDRRGERRRRIDGDRLQRRPARRRKPPPRSSWCTSPARGRTARLSILSTNRCRVALVGPRSRRSLDPQPLGWREDVADDDRARDEHNEGDERDDQGSRRAPRSQRGDAFE